MFRRILAAAAALAFLLPFAGCAAHAAAPPYITMTVGTCDPSYPTRCMKPNADGSINITGSVSAGAAFAPTGQATLSVTTTSARVALPAASANVTLVNTGAQTAYFLLGNGSVTATTTTGYPLQPGSSITLAVGANTNVAAITSTSTTSLSVTSGTGVPALAGGGSSGGGGGGAVTVADGADVTQGALADAACATDNGTCTVAAVLKRIAQRNTSILTALGSPFQAGGSIGNTTFASTQSGAWNITNITGTVSLPTGAATSALQTTGNTSLGTIATNSGTQATAANQTSVTGSKAPGTAAASALLTGGVYTSAGVTLTNGQQAAVQMTSDGAIRVSGAAGGGTAQGATTSGVTGTLGLTATTTAAPTYTNGTVNPPSTDVKGSTRVLLMDTTGAPLDPTAASAVQCGTTTGTMVQCGLDNVNGSTGSTAPTRATLMGANASGNMAAIVQASASAKVSISTNTITQVVALSSGKSIYVTNFNLHSAGTTTTKWVYGTGTNCGTGTTDLTDLYDFTASDGMVVGGGLGAVLVVPASNALCIQNTAATHVGGSVAYSQF